MKYTTVSSGCHRPAVAALALAAALVAGPASAASKGGTDWLWLSSWLDTATCTFTTKVDWGGFKQAKSVEAFVTLGYAGSKLVPIVTRIQTKDNTLTVTLPPLATSATWNMFYPWAQLLDSKDVAIPASLDFTGQQGGYCQAP